MGAANHESRLSKFKPADHIGQLFKERIIGSFWNRAQRLGDKQRLWRGRSVNHVGEPPHLLDGLIIECYNASHMQPDQPPNYPSQSPQQPQQQDHYHVNQPPQSNGMATAGFILSFFTGALGLIFSIIGFKRSKELNGSGRDLAIAGIIISCISIAISLLFLLVLVSVIGASTALIQEASEKLEEAAEELEELEELEEGSLEVYSSFSVDNHPQAVKIITGDSGLGQLDDEFYYSPETPETCQYYLTNHAVERDTVDTLEYWTQYTAPITLSPLETHVIAQGCGEWQQVDSL